MTGKDVDEQDRLAIQITSSRLISQMLVFLGNAIAQGEPSVEVVLPHVPSEHARTLFAQAFNQMAGEFHRLEQLGISSGMDYTAAAQRLGIFKEEK